MPFLDIPEAIIQPAGDGRAFVVRDRPGSGTNRLLSDAGAAARIVPAAHPSAAPNHV